MTIDPQGRYRQLVHGNTEHGRQSLDPRRRREPLAYYHPTGPIGGVFKAFDDRLAKGRVGLIGLGSNPLATFVSLAATSHRAVGLIGLGAGSLAYYARPGQEWTFYEIDPVVRRVAWDPAFFTFLADCRAGKLDVILGDGRLRIAKAPDGWYDLIVLDAFSSDAIPVHLLTTEAIAVYLAKLKPGGVLAFHISNRYLDLKPVLAALARDADLVCLGADDLDLSSREREAGKKPSQWAVMARKPEALDGLRRSIYWQPLLAGPGVRAWTDDFSNLLSVLRWE